MFVKHGLPEGGESEVLAADALLENCNQQYRSAGMTYEDIEGHIREIVANKQEAAAKATEEKMEYRDVY